MLALTVDSAKNIAIFVVIALLAMMLLSAWIIKNITTKVLTVAVVAALALVVWSQRSSLSECGDKLKERAAAGDLSSQTCSFFGKDVKLPGKG